MEFLVMVSGFFGYFLILIIFMILSIIFAKKRSAWLWYLAGAICSFFSLYGKEIKSNVLHTEIDMTPYWIIYFLLLIMLTYHLLINNQNIIQLLVYL